MTKKEQRLQQTIHTLEGAYDKIDTFLDTEEPRMGKGKYPSVRATFSALVISENVYQDGAIVTADAGYANETNMRYVYENSREVDELRQFRPLRRKRAMKNSSVKEPEGEKIVPHLQKTMNEE